MTSPGQHWHGYGPWTGPPSTFERVNEGLRRPSDPAFLQSTAPPIELGHYLLRRSATTRELTWIGTDGPLSWMTETYGAHPPDPRLNYEPLTVKIGHTRDGLLGGTDAYWHHHMSNERVFAVAVIGCPHRHHTQTPCPLPPR